MVVILSPKPVALVGGRRPSSCPQDTKTSLDENSHLHFRFPSMSSRIHLCKSSHVLPTIKRPRSVASSSPCPKQFRLHHMSCGYRLVDAIAHAPISLILRPILRCCYSALVMPCCLQRQSRRRSKKFSDPKTADVCDVVRCAYRTSIAPARRC